jgi:hypothetical protein
MAGRRPGHPEEVEGEPEPVWRSRLRWRLRGATMWPAFAVLTVLDAVVLATLPFAGTGPGFVGAILLCGFANLVVVAALAPVGGRVLRHRRPALPREVAGDRAGTVLLGVLTALLVAGGLAHRDTVLEEDRDFALQSQAVREFVAAQAPAEFARNVDDADTWQQGPGLYRTCVPGSDPRRHLCLLVSTREHPPGITVDPDQQPNARVAGPRNAGRIGG